MGRLKRLLDSNRQWAQRMSREDPTFFSSLVAQQAPRYLWIGCSDSRVPSTQIVDLPPGEIFVHRNVANIVVHADLNCLAAIQYAVDVLKVEHIIVVGHYGCGGVQATLNGLRVGLADNWLRHVGDVMAKHDTLLDATVQERRLDVLCELNVIEQVVNVCQTTIVRDAWDRQQPVCVHGWIYALTDGCVRELGMEIDSFDRLAESYQSALQAIGQRAAGENVYLPPKADEIVLTPPATSCCGGRHD
jgi:carbonic anhydrase